MKERLLRLTAIIQVVLALVIACGIVLFIWLNWLLVIKIEGSFMILLMVVLATDGILDKYLEVDEINEDI